MSVYVHRRDGTVRYVIRTHFARRGARRTACGRLRRKTKLIDTSKIADVDCKTCLKSHALRD